MRGEYVHSSGSWEDGMVCGEWPGFFWRLSGFYPQLDELSIPTLIWDHMAYIYKTLDWSAIGQVWGGAEALRPLRPKHHLWLTTFVPTNSSRKTVVWHVHHRRRLCQCRPIPHEGLWHPAVGCILGAKVGFSELLVVWCGTVATGARGERIGFSGVAGFGLEAEKLMAVEID